MTEINTTFEQNFVLEQYRSLRAEIVARIQEHHRLWFWKLVSAGAILSFSLTNASVNVKYAFALAPFLSVVFDALIVNNLVLIGGVGRYISETIEKNNRMEGWDSASLKNRYFGTKKRQWLNDWLIVNVTTVGILAVTVFLFSSVENIFSWKTISFLVVAIIIVVWHAITTWNKLCSNKNNNQEQSIDGECT